MSYTISKDQRSITCKVCGFRSHNQNDVTNRYCGQCHVFHHDELRPLTTISLTAGGDLHVTNNGRYFKNDQTALAAALTILEVYWIKRS